MEGSAEIATGEWAPVECPFRIEFSRRVLDDIRLAVVDAFFSLPRGGAEIGGILLGRHDAGLVAITDFEALDCEHAMGPSFTLSARDQTRMAEMIAKAARNPAHRQPVGWYHSHTRSEIFLSEADQEIHKRYFAEPWQVALVLKPHTFEPTRGGFFFRGADGAMRGASTYQEFVLTPLPLKQGANGGSNGPAVLHRPLHEEPVPPPTLVEQPAAAPPPAAKEKGRVPITREIPAASSFTGAEENPPAPPLDLVPEVIETPHFVDFEADRSGRGMKVVVWLALGLVAAGVGYQTRGAWLPAVIAKIRPALPRDADSYLSLQISDDSGQLRIQWDREAPAVKTALDAMLEITDGDSTPQKIRLDQAHLATGALTYGRETERVDVALIATQPNGEQVREQASYLGKLPARKGHGDDSDIRKERDALAGKAEKLQKELEQQAGRTRKLENDLKQMQNEKKRGAPRQ